MPFTTEIFDDLRMSNSLSRLGAAMAKANDDGEQFRKAVSEGRQKYSHLSKDGNDLVAQVHNHHLAREYHSARAKEYMEEYQNMVANATAELDTASLDTLEMEVRALEQELEEDGGCNLTRYSPPRGALLTSTMLIVPLPSRAAPEEAQALVPLVKRLVRQSPGIIRTLVEEGFPTEIGSMIEEKYTRMSGQLSSVRGKFGNLHNEAVAQVKQQLLHPDRLARLEKPLREQDEYLRIEMDNAEKLMERFSSEVQEYQNALNQYQEQARNDAPDEDIRQLELSLATAREELETAREDLNSARWDAARSQTEASENKRELENARGLIEAYKENVSELEEKVTAKDLLLTASQHQEARLNDELQRVKEDLSTAGTALSDAKGDLEDARGLIKTLEHDASKSNAELSSSKVQISKLEEKLAALRAEASQLKIELDSSNLRLSIFEPEKQRLTDTVDDLSNQVTVLSGQLANRDREYEDAEDKWSRDRASLEKAKTEWMERANSHLATIQAGKTRADTLQGELDVANEKLTNLQLAKHDELQAADTRFEELQQRKRDQLKTASDEKKELQLRLRRAEKALEQEQGVTLTITAALSKALTHGDDAQLIDDIVGLHQMSMSLAVSSPVSNNQVIQVLTGPVRDPTYSTAFDLWIDARRGIINLDCAAPFLNQHEVGAGQQAFLPWIHGAVRQAIEILSAGMARSGVWTSSTFMEVVVVMQLLAFIHRASQGVVSGLAWYPELKEMGESLSRSAANLPRSFILSDLQARLQNFLATTVPLTSWINVVSSEGQLDSTNSTLPEGTYLILDNAVDSFVLVTGEVQSIHLLSHEDVLWLDVRGFGDVELKLRSALPITSLMLRTADSGSRTMGVFAWANAFFLQHMRVMDPGV